MKVVGVLSEGSAQAGCVCLLPACLPGVHQTGGGSRSDLSGNCCLADKQQSFQLEVGGNGQDGLVQEPGPCLRAGSAAGCGCTVQEPTDLPGALVMGLEDGPLRRECKEDL